MGLVRTWSRQVARAAGASVIAPLVLLVAAGLVASGGGLGGLGSLRQLTSGPSVPETGLRAASRSSIEGSEIVGADVTAPRERARSAPPPTQLAAATPPPPAPPPARSPVGARRPRTRIELRPQPPTVGSPLTDTGEGRLGNPPGSNRPAGGVDPAGLIRETTEGLGDSLPEPFQPVTDQLLDVLLLLAPPRRQGAGGR